MPAPQIGEMFMKTASRQHHKVYAHDLNFIEIMSNLKINFMKVRQVSLTLVCIESKLICSFSETTKSQSQESTEIVDIFLSTNTDF